MSTALFGRGRRRRPSLARRLFGFTAPIVVVALASTTVLASPVWMLPGKVEDVEVRIDRALEAHALGTLITEQSKQYLMYLYLDVDRRPALRREIAANRTRGDLLVAQAPAQVHHLWRELQASGAGLVRAVDDDRAPALRTAVHGFVSVSETLGDAAHKHADESQGQAQQALDRITGVWSLLPAGGGDLGASLAAISAESRKALAATHAEHAATHFVAAFPVLLSGAGQHTVEKAAAAAVDAQKVLKRVPGQGAADAETRRRVDLLLGVLDQLRADGREVAALAAAGDTRAATAMFETRLDRRFTSELLPGMTALIELHQARLGVATRDAQAAARGLQTLLLSGNAVFLAIVALAGVWLLRGVGRPVRQLEVAHRRLADGDTTTRIRPDAAGPLGELATSFNLLAEELATGSSARLAKAVLDHSDDVLLVVDAGVVTWASPAAHQLQGGATSVVGSAVGELLLDADRAHRPVRARLRRADDALGDYELTWVDLLHDPQVRAHLLLARDVTERARQQADLAHRATHDLLTGLPNRTRAVTALEELAAARRAVAMLFCDVDHFKDVNDSLGHAAGDALLVEMASRLLLVTRHVPDAVVARLGGDEFVVLLPDACADDGGRVAVEIGAALSAGFVIEGTRHEVSCSLGLASAAAGAAWEPASLLQEADLAMYRAKRDGRARVLEFCPDMQDELMQRLRVDRALANDLDGCVRVHYQPIVRADGSRPAGVEALLRWQDGDEVLPPSLVVARAEATGTISALGLKVLSMAAQHVAAWRRDLAPDLELSVNVSVVELERADYARDALAALADAGLPPSAVTLEVTESAVGFDEGTLVDNLRALRAAGAALSIDDFGTGWSSLSRLELIAPNEIKLDRSFVTPLTSGADAGLVRAVLAIARELGCRVVAEGVELDEQRAVLAELGTDLMQGYLFARPLDPRQVQAYLLGGTALVRLPLPRRPATGGVRATRAVAGA